MWEIDCDGLHAGGIPDSGGNIRERTLSEVACSDVGYAENSWTRRGTELSSRRVDREKI